MLYGTWNSASDVGKCPAELDTETGLRASCGDGGRPVERRRVVDRVVSSRDEVQLVAVGGQRRWWRRYECCRRLTTYAAPARSGPIDMPAVDAALDRHAGPLVQATAAASAGPSCGVRVGVEGVERRCRSSSMKVVARPREQCRHGPRRRTADVSVTVLGARHEARGTGGTESGGRVQMSRSTARPRLVGRRAVRAASRHRQHRRTVEEVVGTS